MNAALQKQAIIYCRVASRRIGTNGEAIIRQKVRCREYAETHGYEIACVFEEIGPGDVTPRPGFGNLLSFLRERPDASFTVIVDSMSVLARDVEAYVFIRDALDAAGAKLKSPSIDLGTDGESALIERLSVSIAQFEGWRGSGDYSGRERAQIRRALRVVRRAFE
jgi:site-specific DNA recombinase